MLHFRHCHGEATVAQLAEQLIRNQQVRSSTLLGGSIFTKVSCELLANFFCSVCGFLPLSSKARIASASPLSNAL